MWTVTVYRDNGYSGENYGKHFEEEVDAEDFFRREIQTEFEDEIEKGLVSDQEIENIVMAGIFIYESEAYEVTITLEAAEDMEEDLDVGHGYFI